MTVTDDVRNEYAASIRQLIAQLDGPMLERQSRAAQARTVGAADESGDSLNSAVDGYAAASTAFFEATKSSDLEQAWSSIGADLRAVQHLVDHTRSSSGEQVEALLATTRASQPTFADAMGEVLTTVESGPAGTPPAARVELVAEAAAASVPTADDSIQAIADAGWAKMKAVVATGALEVTGAEIGQALGMLLGPEVGDGIGKAIQSMAAWYHRVKQSVLKLLQVVVDKLKSWLDATAIGDLTAWVEKVLDPGAIFDQIVGVPELKAKAATALTPANTQACTAEIAAIKAANDGAEKWIGRATTALNYANPLLSKFSPWGPIAAGAIWAGLLVAAGIITVDHLDSPTLPWTPTFHGVGAVLAACGTA